MIRKATGLLFLICLVSVLTWGATDGQKYQVPIAMHPDTSAPDPWGYTWVKSTDPGGPTFNWVDISTRGTPAPILPTAGGLGDDNSVGPYPILFQFPYYWYSVTNFRIGSNGYVTFGNQAANFANPFTALPNTTIPNDMLAICAGDLDFTVAAANPQCLYWSNGVDSLVISFINVTEWQPAPANPNLKHTFQVVLCKTDSSVTYQYGVQQGQYNSSANNLQLSIGMENQTGQIGLNYTFSTTTLGVPHPGMPANGLAIKFKRTVNTGLAITDAGIVGGFNDGNLAKVIRVGVADTIKGIVKNFGTVPLTNAPVRYAITRTGQPSAFDTVIVPSLQPSQQVTVAFPRLFTPAVQGAYSALFNVTVPGDVGPGNNSRTAELVSASFVIGQPTRIQFENGTVGGSVNWTGGGGMGVAIDLPVYPVRVESVFVQITTVTTNPMTVEILDGSSGSPGTVLATRSVNAVVGMNTVDFISSNVMIAGGRFFVGARGLMAFSYEALAPISFRTWEFTNGWAPYRSGDVQDIIIRASVRPTAPPVAANPDTVCYAGPIPAYPTGVFGHASENLGDTLYIVGSSLAGTPSTAVYTYSMTTRTWSAGVPLPTAKSGGDLVRCGSSLYYIGGGLTAITAGDAAQYKYTPGAGWTAIANIPTPVTGNVAECWGDSVIFCMAGGWSTYLTTVQVYRPASNTWSTSTPIPVGRRSFAGGLWGNKLFVAAGFSGTFRNDFYVGTIGADANTITWAPGPNVPFRGTGSSRPGGHAVNGRFYFITGETTPAPTLQDSIYIWDIAGSTWLPQIIRGRGAGTSSNYWGVVSSTVRGNNLTIWIPGGGLTGTTQWGLYALVDDCNTVDVEPVSDGIPTEYALSQNYPNPFNPTTTLQYSLPRTSHVTLKIYNILGQEVATLVNELHGAGVFQAVWNGQNHAGLQVATGVYFYSLVAKSVDNKSTFVNIKKMLLMK